VTTERLAPLAGEFTREVLDICDRFKREIDYNPVQFRQMVVEHGGPETARRLLAGARRNSGWRRCAGWSAVPVSTGARRGWARRGRGG
jgi:hypothetical protein